METKQPVSNYYYSESEWDRLGCGPLPPERNISKNKSPIGQEIKDQPDVNT